MKRIGIKRDIRVVLELTEKEVNWLKSFIQNPRELKEEVADHEIRTELFTLLTLEPWDK